MSKPDEEKPTWIHIGSPVSPFSPPEEIPAWLGELDDLEKEVAPNSEATEDIEVARREARLFLRVQQDRIAAGLFMQYAPARKRPGR